MEQQQSEVEKQIGEELAQTKRQLRQYEEMIAQRTPPRGTSSVSPGRYDQNVEAHRSNETDHIMAEGMIFCIIHRTQTNDLNFPYDQNYWRLGGLRMRPYGVNYCTILRPKRLKVIMAMIHQHQCLLPCRQRQSDRPLQSITDLEK